MELQILFHDDHYVAVDKPPGLLVHRTPLAKAEDFALQRLRRQLKRRVYPVHRLDRPTSGVLLFGLSAAAARAACEAFEARQVEKRYLAIVRGWCEQDGEIDYPLCEEDDGRPPQEALTRYRRLACVELPIMTSPRYPTSRYSLLEVSPQTGRKHQIRKHFHHIFHPLIGDTTYGEGRHNRLFRERFGTSRLMLMAHELCLSHPLEGRRLTIRAPLDGEWLAALCACGWENWASVLSGEAVGTP